MLRVVSGIVDQRVPFKAPTGTVTFTVYRKRGTGSWTIMTTPTVTEDDSTNAPGAFSLLMDEDMTISSNKRTEYMSFFITAGGMPDTTVNIELIKDLPSDVQKINDIEVIGDGEVGTEWNPI